MTAYFVSLFQPNAAREVIQNIGPIHLFGQNEQSDQPARAARLR